MGSEPTTDSVARSRLVVQGDRDAGVAPVEEYELTRDGAQHPFESLDEAVPIEFGERFTATFTGPTPVS